MTYTPFLKQVAQYYARRGAATLRDLCFVFPNKRSATFFRRYLRDAVTSDKPWIEPELADMVGFIGRFSALNEASRYESLFTLYRCYREMNHADMELTFDRFLFWGEMIINDFNDVDRYLVDADMLFTNLRRLREIGSTYLTEEQVDIINRYWGGGDEASEHGTGAKTHYEEVEGFWLHLQKNGSKSVSRFKRLWEVLGPLYDAYVKALEDRGLTTRGRLYRLAAEGSKGGNLTDGGNVNYVFVGFNVLTTSELKILRNLKAMGRAEFFWDFNSPALRSPMNKAGRFIRKNIEEFPSPDDFEEEVVDSFPRIEVIGVPSSVGQTKMASQVIGEWVKQGLVCTEQGGINTAVVLPDESLFIPMIHSMPASVADMNVTMGFPMRLSPVSALIGNLWLLQKNARRDHEGHVEGFFHADVTNILSMPLVQGLDPQGVANINTVIRERRLYSVSPSVIEEISPLLAPVFLPIDRKAPTSEIISSLHRITDYLHKEAAEAKDSLTCMFLESYREAVDTLAASMCDFGVEMDAFTFLRLVSRAVRGDTVQFDGEPLRGLQVMGMLETRSLDFRQLVVTSMNERVFPRRQHTRSFIPDLLRRAFGMATADFQESIFAYYFYRLISRAEKVTLLYDSRIVGGLKSSEMSRYLIQLLYLFPEAKANHVAARFEQSVFTHETTTIRKTEVVMTKLRRFITPDSGFALSASSINTYINCPLLFYLQYVERFNPDDEITDYVDFSTYGSIVHYVMEHLYARQQVDGSPVVISKEFIERLLKPECTVVDNLIHEAVNIHYYHINEPERFVPLVGETAVLGKVILFNIRHLLKRELEVAPFTFIGAEKRVLATMKINEKISINIKQVIDRIDKLDNAGLLRIVDYKTGSDDLSTPSIEALFDSSLTNRPKAIMQLFFYCYIYAHVTNYDGPIMPVIYKMRNLVSREIEPLKIGTSRDKRVIDDYREYIDEFITHFKAVIEEMFNPEVPFRPATNDHACTFCNFKSLCSRKNENE